MLALDHFLPNQKLKLAEKIFIKKSNIYKKLQYLIFMFTFNVIKHS